MRVKIRECLLELVIGDIVTERVDAIVNAANRQLAGGAGVDGAIHRAGGPQLMQQLRENYPQGCPVGSAAVTHAGQLQAKYVFHAVGPVWRGGRAQEEEALRSAYRSCLLLAKELHCSSIAFPALSTGVYGYPLDLATTAALDEIRLFLQTDHPLRQIRCVLYHEGIYGAYCRVLESWDTAAGESVE